jgi:hypothetical protein
MKSAKTQKGTALVMALVLVPMLMLLAATFVDPIVRSYRAAVADQKSLLARNIAENFFEEAMLASQDTGVGETVHHPQDPDPITRDYGFGVAQGSWTVYQTPETDAEHLITVAGQDYYTIPSPGSGDAGGDYCSTNEPVVTAEALAGMQDFLGISPKPLDGSVDENHILEWPCHWNKLKEGESISIPLYVESGGTVLNPSDLQLNDFELIIRPACKPENAATGGRSDSYLGEICANNERFELEGEEPLKDDTEVVIVLWEISGKEKSTDNNVVVQPYFMKLNPDFNSNFTVRSMNNFDIGSGMPYTMNQDSLATDNPSDAFDFDTLSNYLQDLNKPVLRLRAIHTLREDGTNRTVPYLEYQFKSPDISVSPISSTSKVVTVDVMVEGGYSETIERTIPLPKPITGFVIQQ